MKNADKTDAGRARAREVDSASTGAMDGARTRGQAMLQAVDGSVRAKAARVGCSVGAVGNWQSGKVVPDDDKRALLERALGIPRRAWDEAPDGGATPVAPVAPKARPEAPRPPERAAAAGGDLPATMEMVDEQLTILRRQQSTEGMTVSEGIRLADSIGKLTAQRARLEAEAVTMDERIIAHPFWQRFKWLLRALLLPHPELLAQLDEHLRAWGDES